MPTDDKRWEMMLEGLDKLLGGYDSKGSPPTNTGGGLKGVKDVKDLQNLNGLENTSGDGSLFADGVYSLRVSPDKMSAYVDLLPAAGEGQPLDYEKTESEIAAQGIRGIFSLAISQGIDRCNNTNMPQENILIAQGIPCQPSAEANIDILFAIVNEEEEEDETQDVNKKVDYREKGRIQSVSAGDHLVVFTPAEQGVPGLDVYGKGIFAQKVKEIVLNVGKGVEILEDGCTYAATMTGQPVLDKTGLRVEDIFTVRSDINYSTGNIYFDGSVVIKGNVNEGFSVDVEADALIYGNIEQGAVRAKNNVTVRGGLIGERALIECGNDAKLKFVEGGTIKAEGNITVSKHSLHGNIHSGGAVTFTGRNGPIGGIVEALGKIDTFNAGSPIGTRTSIAVGYNFSLRLQLEEAEGVIASLDAEISKLTLFVKAIMAKYTIGNEVKLPQQMNEKIASVLEHCKKKSRDKESHVKKIEVIKKLLFPEGVCKSLIKVKGSIYPGVLLSIRKERKQIKDMMRFTTFYLSEETGEMSFAPY